MNMDEEVQKIWAKVSAGREGYISSDLKDAAKEGIRVAIRQCPVCAERRSKQCEASKRYRDKKRG